MTIEGVTLEINPIVETIKDLQARTDVLRGYL
jgi:phosphoenolpyruvate carboxylase